MKQKFLFFTSILTLAALALASPVMADDGELLGLVKDMQKEMKGMKQTIETQDRKIDMLENRQPSVSAAPTGEAGAAAPMSDYEFNQHLDSSLGGAQKWLKDLSFKGDIRLRYEAFVNRSGARESDPRNRFRFRLRYGFEKKFTDEIKTGFSMASGDSLNTNGLNSDPTSTNSTLTNDFNFKNIWIEKVYATYTPAWAKVGPVKKLEITGGKFDNPFEKGSSDLVWDRDVKPEGLFEKVDFDIFSSSDLSLTGWLTAGQMPLKETQNLAASDNNASPDAQLFAEQLGLNAVIYTPMLERPVDYTSAASFYGWNHYAKNSNFFIGGQSLARGNSNSTGSTTDLDTAGFDVFELYQELAFYPNGLPVRPYFDWARNFNGESPASITGANNLNAWATGVKIGGIVKKGDWETLYQYKWIGANSMPGFNDSDFGYTNHTGKAGHVLKAGYALTDFLNVNVATFYVRPLNEGTNTIIDQREFRSQVDLVWKF